MPGVPGPGYLCSSWVYWPAYSSWGGLVRDSRSELIEIMDAHGNFHLTHGPLDFKWKLSGKAGLNISLGSELRKLNGSWCEWYKTRAYWKTGPFKPKWSEQWAWTLDKPYRWGNHEETIIWSGPGEWIVLRRVAGVLCVHYIEQKNCTARFAMWEITRVLSQSGWKSYKRVSWYKIKELFPLSTCFSQWGK